MHAWLVAWDKWRQRREARREGLTGRAEVDKVVYGLTSAHQIP